MSDVDPYDATFQHIEIIARKIDKLMAAQVDAERQVLHRIRCDYTAGELSLDNLYRLYRRYRSLTHDQGPDGKDVRKHLRPTPAALWDETMPIPNNQVVARIKAQEFNKRYEQNEDGYWSGVANLDMHAHRPPDGQAVVYVLFDDQNVPCYVGSTEKFKTRIDTHYRNGPGGNRSRPERGKEFERWVAYPCPDREAAYQLENRLLKEHKPYLNRKASR